MHARPHHAGSPHYRAPRRLTSTVANKNRSMELSELVRMSHSGSLLGMCDSTGIVRPSHLDVPSEGSHAAGPLTEGSSGFGVGLAGLRDITEERWRRLSSPRHRRRQWYTAATIALLAKLSVHLCVSVACRRVVCTGRHPKPFKAAGATEKDGLLYLGSIGKEWVVNGVPLSPPARCHPTTIGIPDFKSLTRGTRALLVHRSGSAAPQLCVGQDARSLRQDHQPRLVPRSLSCAVATGLVKRLAHAPPPLFTDRPQDRQLQSVASSDQHHLPGLSVA